MRYKFENTGGDGYKLTTESLKSEEPFQFGDKVKVWDGSYNVDAETGQHRDGTDPLFGDPAVVLKTDCDVYYHWKLRSEFIKCELLIVFECGAKVYTNSCMVRMLHLTK